MSTSPDAPTWLDRTLRELQEHPEMLMQAGMGDMTEEDLRLLLGTVDESTDISDVIEQLRAHSDRT